MVSLIFEEFLAFKKRKNLASPEKVIGRGEIDCNHVNESVEGDETGRIFGSHGRGIEDQWVSKLGRLSIP